MKSYKYAVVLGLLSAVGPFAIDMYLPALPSISQDLGASTAATQMTLMVFFVTFGVAQIAYGPISDTVGRRKPLFFGLGIFALGGIGCALAPSIEWLIFFRFVQGIGAAACAITPRAIIRDLHTGIAAAKLMSTVMLVFSVAPILAPLIGSTVIVFVGWRGVFAVITLVAVLGILLVALAPPETLPPERRKPLALRPLAQSFGTLFRDLRFLSLTLIAGLGLASFFTFIANASFIYIDHYGMSPLQFSFAFSVNAIGFIGASQFAARLAGRHGFNRVVLTAVTSFMVLSLILLAVTLAGFTELAVLMVGLFLAFACLGLVIPSSMVMALEEHGPIAGVASALGGTIQFLTGAVMVTVASLVFDGTSVPMVAIIAACAVCAFIPARLTLRRPAPAPAAAE